MSISISFGGQNVTFRGWRPGLAPLGPRLALDTETCLIQDGLVPQLVIAAVTDGVSGYFLTNRQVPQFMTSLDPSTQLLMHNAAFDLAVLKQAGGQIDLDRVLDTGLLYKLLLLAETGNCNGPWSLDHVCQQRLGITLPKDLRGPAGENVRTSYSNFLAPDGSTDTLKLLNTENQMYLDYAAKDPIATWFIGENLSKWAGKLFPGVDIFDPSTYGKAGHIDGTDVGAAWKVYGFLTHNIQLKAALALADVERRGMCLDSTQVKTTVDILKQEIDVSLAALKGFNWKPGTGSDTAAKNALFEYEKVSGRKLVRLESGEYSQKADDLEEFRSDSPFIDCYLKYKELVKIQSTFIAKLDSADTKIRGHFNILVNSGRTSCSSSRNEDGEREGLNLQNLPKPRKDNVYAPVRECFVPSPGHVLLAADYSTIELCTLAQHCLKKFKFSKMAEALKKGADLHCVYALYRDGIKLDPSTSWDKKALMPLLGAYAKEKRDNAKAPNFGGIL